MTNANRASERFAALGDPTRRVIFERVAARPSAVGDLAKGMPVSRPAVSQHLRVLEDAGLVAIRKAGRSRFYKLEPAPLRDVVTWADAFAAYFSARLDDLGAYLDRTSTAPTPIARGRRPRRS